MTDHVCLRDVLTDTEIALIVTEWLTDDPLSDADTAAIEHAFEKLDAADYRGADRVR